MRIFHLADLHLGVSSSSLGREEHARLVRKNLEAVLSRAAAEGVPFVVFAGDVFDSNALPTAEVLSLLELMARFETVRSVLLPGGGGLRQGEVRGHDAYTPDSLYRRPEVRALLEARENLFLLRPEAPRLVFPEEGVAFYGGFFALPQAELAPGVRHHVAVMHGSFGEREDLGEVPLREPLPFAYLALGHYHRFRQVSAHAAYSGAFVQFEFLPHRDGVSGYVEVDLSVSPPAVRHRALPEAPRFLYWSVLRPEDLEELRRLDFTRSWVKVSAYLETLEPDLVRLRQEHGDRLSLSEGGRIRPEDGLFLGALEEILAREVPEEAREEVKELLLYGLQVSPKRADFVRFLRSRYGL